ncbi:MAG: hypothetical protein IJB79_05845 [Candidatus Gastranaerophilales bacterium]|nr:hypothetical protein [Candidatus Gastranaerophilales bacterium]
MGFEVQNADMNGSAGLYGAANIKYDYNQQNVVPIFLQNNDQFMSNLGQKQNDNMGFLEMFTNTFLKALSSREYRGINSDFFDENVVPKWEVAQDDTRMPYAVIAPEDVDPNEELPVIVFLHGAGELGNVNKTDFKVYQDIIKSMELEGFRGYILCPGLKSGLWASDYAVECVDEILTSFSETHNIMEDNVSLAGHSLGGQGTIYMLAHNTFNDGVGFDFHRGAVISGYNLGFGSNSGGWESLEDKEIRSYLAQWEDSASSWAMEHYLHPIIGEENVISGETVAGTGHGDIDREAFHLDQDGDGISDLLDWLTTTD